mmetsp:Transcript_37657/g.98635  ORF Transcript_37657/g.98635 Transcript_37657/m.98635 type:complete len:360 (+) Transcript_37657:41-1120(+)
MGALAETPFENLYRTLRKVVDDPRSDHAIPKSLPFFSGCLSFPTTVVLTTCGFSESAGEWKIAAGAPLDAVQKAVEILETGVRPDESLEQRQSLANLEREVHDLRVELGSSRRRAENLERTLAEAQAECEMHRRKAAELQDELLEDDAGQSALAAARQEIEDLKQQLAEAQAHSSQVMEDTGEEQDEWEAEMERLRDEYAAERQAAQEHDARAKEVEALLSEKQSRTRSARAVEYQRPEGAADPWRRPVCPPGRPSSARPSRNPRVAAPVRPSSARSHRPAPAASPPIDTTKPNWTGDIGSAHMLRQQLEETMNRCADIEHLLRQTPRTWVQEKGAIAEVEAALARFDDLVAASGRHLR